MCGVCCAVEVICSWYCAVGKIHVLPEGFEGIICESVFFLVPLFVVLCLGGL